MKTKSIVVWVVGIRIFDVLVAYAATRTIPYLGFFPYKEILELNPLPSFVSAFGNFDGVHYIKIASHGYDTYEQAFFPLYPIVIRAVTAIVGNPLLNAVGISVITGFAAIILWAKLLGELGLDKHIVRDTVLFTLFYPSSFYLGAAYTESLFMLLVVFTFYSVAKGNVRAAAVTAALSSLCRLAGVFLVIPIMIQLVQANNTARLRFSFDREGIKKLVFLISPFVGLGAYMTYLYFAVGDPFYFVNVQPVYGAYRSTHIILLPQVLYRYMRIFITAHHDVRYYVSILEFVLFNAMFFATLIELTKAVKLPANTKNWVRFSLSLFSLAYIILPSLTGTLSSMPRYSLLALSGFITFATVRNEMLRYTILGFSIILHTVVLGYFIQGYFVG